MKVGKIYVGTHVFSEKERYMWKVDTIVSRNSFLGDCYSIYSDQELIHNYTKFSFINMIELTPLICVLLRVDYTKGVLGEYFKKKI